MVNIAQRGMNKLEKRNTYKIIIAWPSLSSSFPQYEGDIPCHFNPRKQNLLRPCWAEPAVLCGFISYNFPNSFHYFPKFKVKIRLRNISNYLQYIPECCSDFLMISLFRWLIIFIQKMLMGMWKHYLLMDDLSTWVPLPNLNVQIFTAMWSRYNKENKDRRKPAAWVFSESLYDLFKCRVHNAL